jgi:dTDP-4-dehydrorhamnose reductase
MQMSSGDRGISMKILLTGVNGQVGWELQRTLVGLGELIPTARIAPIDGLSLDLVQPDVIRQVIQDIKPNVIVNAAAYTAVDKAESEPDLAMAVNGIAPAVMAEEAKKLGAVIVHYSTDYVFNGQAITPYTEADITDPINVYGKTKLAGEEAIRAIGIPHLVLRTSWVYGLRGKNFLRTMLKLAQEREEIEVVDDQIGIPTWSRTIAEATAQVLTQLTARHHSFHDQAGTYHLTCTGQTSWYGFAKAIFEHTSDVKLFRLKQLTAIPSTDYPTSSKRPAFSCLNTQKIVADFNLFLPAWDLTLELAIASEATA